MTFVSSFSQPLLILKNVLMMCSLTASFARAPDLEKKKQQKKH